ncbi:MAG: zinc ribbon domain-containing protein [Clostridia bacterium]|nr:zinc ribbon domain-containing protein [Clostridia bacterium]
MFCPECGKELRSGARFCAWCGAVTTGEPAVLETRFCPACGAEIKDGYAFCEKCGEPVGRDGEVPKRADLTRVPTMTIAANLAVERNPTGEWSYWDTPDVFTTGAKRLLRFSEKEDRRLASDPEGAYVYLVSPGGAIGHIFTDDGGERVLEWVYFTETDRPDTLPMTAAECE